jgi:N-methylhydantoinase A
VAEFHRRNEEARLIEARAQEPVLRGVRLTAVGVVDKPEAPELSIEGGDPEPVARRDLWVDGDWHRQAAVYDWADLSVGPTLTGPAAIQSPFTTVILRPGDEATLSVEGDLVIDVAPLLADVVTGSGREAARA